VPANRVFLGVPQKTILFKMALLSHIPCWVTLPPTQQDGTTKGVAISGHPGPQCSHSGGNQEGFLMLAGRSRICKGCWQQLRFPVPLRGVAALPFRAFGIRPSRMNPNTCTICEMMFTKVMRARKVRVDVSVLFADLRGYTALSQSLPDDQIAAVLDLFYDGCAAAIWEYDGLLNKTVGDAIMAIFNFPIRQPDHAARAVEAAREIHRRCRSQHSMPVGPVDGNGGALEIGIGIDSGMVSFGEFGRSHRDLTAIGTVVNTAARAQTAAQAGQILVTRAVRDRSGPPLAGAKGRLYALKGITEPVELYAA
jgi:adenylate cyclase